MARPKRDTANQQDTHAMNFDEDKVVQEMNERAERAQQYVESLELAGRVTEEDLRMQVCI